MLERRVDLSEYVESLFSRYYNGMMWQDAGMFGIAADAALMETQSARFMFWLPYT
jgi:hypothetical protein